MPYFTPRRRGGSTEYQPYQGYHHDRLRYSPMARWLPRPHYRNVSRRLTPDPRMPAKAAIPARARAGPLMPRAQPQARAALPGGHETILLAEDEAALRRIGERVLGRLGYRVLTAGDGDEALRIFHEHESEIDLVISDSVMPHLGGVAVYEALHRHDPPIRFILASGEPPGGEHPPDIPFLPKPWSIDDLARRVREVLDR